MVNRGDVAINVRNVVIPAGHGDAKRWWLIESQKRGIELVGLFQTFPEQRRTAKGFLLRANYGIGAASGRAVLQSWRTVETGCMRLI